MQTSRTDNHTQNSLSQEPGNNRFISENITALLEENNEAISFSLVFCHDTFAMTSNGQGENVDVESPLPVHHYLDTTMINKRRAMA